MNRNLARMVMLLAEILGGASLVLFGAFVFLGAVLSVRLNFSEMTGLYWDAFLSLAFFAQHSLMVRRSFKDRLARICPREFHAAIYAIASGIILAVVMLLWQATPVIVSLPGPARWALRAMAVAALFGFAWGVRALGSFDTFGRQPIAARLRGEVLRPPEFVVRGPYRWVRHPLMFFMLVLIWAMPDLGADRILFNVLWTVWMAIGCYFEERDLVVEFGEAYRRYQRVVPMVLPWRGPAGKDELTSATPA